jgi:hypothetical protein
MCNSADMKTMTGVCGAIVTFDIGPLGQKRGSLLLDACSVLISSKNIQFGSGYMAYFTKLCLKRDGKVTQ